MQEEVDDVEVQVDRGHDVLLRRQLVHQHVGVKYDEQREQQGPAYCNSLVHHRGREKYLYCKDIYL